MARRTNAFDRPRLRRLGPLWYAAAAVLLLAFATWFAPAIVGATPLCEAFAQRFAPEFQGRVTIESAALDCLSPILLKNVRVEDGDGRVLFQLSSVRTEKALWELVLDQSDLGQIWLEGLTLHTRTRVDGTNLEDAFAPLIQADDAPPRLGDSGVSRKSKAKSFTIPKRLRRWRSPCREMCMMQGRPAPCMCSSHDGRRLPSYIWFPNGCRCDRRSESCNAG